MGRWVSGYDTVVSDIEQLGKGVRWEVALPTHVEDCLWYRPFSESNRFKQMLLLCAVDNQSDISAVPYHCLKISSAGLPWGVNGVGNRRIVSMGSGYHFQIYIPESHLARETAWKNAS